MIKTPQEKHDILTKLGFDVKTLDWSEYHLLTLAKLAHEDKWERLYQTVKLLQKPQLVALLIQLVIDNQILSHEFVEHVNRTISNNKKEF